MKAQVTIEFLFSFLALLIALVLLVQTLTTERQVIDQKIINIDHIHKAEAGSRAAELRLTNRRSGIEISKPDFSEDRFTYQGINNKVQATFQDGRMVEIGILYDN